MAPVTMRRSRVDDDDDLSLYDPEWLARGKKVVRDGGVVRTSIMLMDGVPNPRLCSMTPRCIARIRSASSTAPSGGLPTRPMRSATSQLENAWRSCDVRRLRRFGTANRRATSTSSAVSHAYRTPTGRNDPADDVEALQRRWASPGATPGPGRRPTQDAGPRSDADQAYDEYCARLQSAWKTR